MILQYSLSESDYLDHLLFNAAVSEKIKKKRIKNRIFVTAIFILLSIVFLLAKEQTLCYASLLLAVFSFIFYPLYESRQYRKFYQQQVTTAYNKMTSHDCSLLVSEDLIRITDTSGEHTLNLSELEKIIERNRYFYLQFKSSGTIIIPKNKIKNVEILRSEL